MAFSSAIFLFAFLPLVLLGYYLLDRRFKNAFLLIASLFFYAWGEPRFVFVMLGSIVVNHGFAFLIDRNLTRAETEEMCATGGQYNAGIGRPQKRAKLYLYLAVLFNLSLFFVYKYLDFTIANLNAVGALIGAREISLRHIALPIGISFFTFQAMSYVFDVYRRKGKAQKNPMYTALYIALFPQLIAGPIVRYETVAAELAERRETLDDFARGVRRFIVGLAKKVVLANSLAVLADLAFGFTDASRLSVLMAWMGAIAYTLQIYYDFSGYSDMAIGLGLMFGFHFNENFNYPYSSKSVSEFWRRWHISLGSWFRDYVYIPLGGSRAARWSRRVANLFAVWLLTGVWHGAAWTFILWGLFYFVLLTFEKTTDMPARLRHPLGRLAYQAAALVAVAAGWVVFRSESVGSAVSYLGAMFGLTGNPVSDAAAVFMVKQSALLLAVSVLCSTPALSKLCGEGRSFSVLKECATAALYFALFIVGVSFTVTSTYNPFIYFNF